MNSCIAGVPASKPVWDGDVMRAATKYYIEPTRWHTRRTAADEQISLAVLFSLFFHENALLVQSG